MSNLTQLQDLADQYSKYDAKQKLTWCSGCGDYGIFSGIKRALVMQKLQPHQILFCFDVGCNGNASDKIGAYTIHGLHGRVTSLATGASLANSKIKVLATAGDGATFSEGINHLAHSIRNNADVTFICHNNSNYGLTIGQASSTTRLNQKMNASPDGVVVPSLNTLQFVLSLNPTFVARSFSGDVDHISEMVQKGLNHKGFSYIEVMQACPTFNKATPQEWYWDKIKYIDERNHDSSDIWAARKLVDDMDKNLAVGLIYQNQNEQDLLSKIPSRQDLQQSTLVEEVDYHPIRELLAEFY